jgi:methyl-accepting chemotaxis protein
VQSAIDEAMRELDAVTQKNAARVERTERTGRALSDVVGEIAESVGHFRLREAARKVA